MAEIVRFPAPEYRNVAETLRRIADGIEAGDYGDVRNGVLCLRGSGLDVFAMGEGDAESAYLLLGCAKTKFEFTVIEKSGGFGF